MSENQSQFRLSDAPIAQSLRIVATEHQPGVSRLLSMGLRPGVVLKIIRKAAFGTTLYLETEMQQYGIRSDEAALIWVTEVR